MRRAVKGEAVWYVYALRGNGRIYIGLTGDLRRRVNQHQHGHTRTTKRMGRLQLIFYEAFISKGDASKQEKFYKSGYGREVLHQKLSDTLSS